LRQQGLARARGADKQDVALGQLHLVLVRLVLVAQALVVVVHRHRQGALGDLLADDVVVQVGLDLGRRGQVAARLAAGLTRGKFIPDDFVAQVDALVADKDRRTGDQLLHLVLALAAKRAVKGFFAGRAFFLGHGGLCLVGKLTG